MMECALYLVATPIGNLGDISQRAKEVLSEVDFVAAEDTRVTQKLFFALGLPKKPMISYYEHNKRAKGEWIATRIAGGESCALVTDAGMPAISDPGEELVALCAEQDIRVIMIPGACAAVSALAISGLPTGRFCFEGFLSVNKKARREHLKLLETETRTMVFYEAPHKLRRTLVDLLETFGAERRIAICREITKLHEETLRMTLAEAVQYYEQVQPKGEFVLILDGGAKMQPQEESASMQQAISLAISRIEAGQTHKDAVKEVAELVGIKKNELYRRMLEQQRLDTQERER